ncbi:MAG: ribonuclease P protein component [Patescibacteria group bacterium]
MIPRAERLPVRGERRKPFHISRTQYFTVKVFPPGSTKTRFAILVGKSVFREATKRNRLKRVLAKTMRAVHVGRSPVDILVIALPHSGKDSETEILGELTRALRAIP